MNSILDACAKILAVIIIIGMAGLSVGVQSPYRPVMIGTILCASVGLVVCRVLSTRKHDSDLDSTKESAGGETFHQDDFRDP